MRQSVRDSEQQAVGGRHGGGKATSGHKARDHIGKTGDFRRSQNHNVALHEELVDLQDAVTVAVDDLHEADTRPVLDPVKRIGVGNGLADDACREVRIKDRELCEGRQSRCREVQQEDEHQRPADGLTCSLDGRGGEVAHQHVRQRCGTCHHTQNQGEELPLGHKCLAGIIDTDRQGGKALGLGSGFSRRLQLANLMEGFEFLHTENGVELRELRDKTVVQLV